MNKNFLPYFNSLNEKEKTFWLECSKEELIDHFIANVKNGEELLGRIDNAIEYIKEHKEHEYRNGNDNEYYLELNENKMNELLEILGDKENE